MKKIICFLLGHKYSFNFGWMANKCECKRCGIKWKLVENKNKDDTLFDDPYVWEEIK